MKTAMRSPRGKLREITSNVKSVVKATRLSHHYCATSNTIVIRITRGPSTANTAINCTCR